jgi:TolB-like protein
VRDSTDEQLVRLPTGDGMALVFHHSAEEPARCALEIAEALRKHPEIPVRMGIHSGPVSEVTDVSGRSNLAGAGINMAQRVMDCGDAGHILLSQHVADDLVQYRQWAPRLRDLGECEVKHGVRLHLVNLYAEPLGNPETPEKFRQIAAAASTPSPVVKPKRMPWHEIVIALLFVAAVIAAAFFSLRKGVPLGASAAVPQKSIAVLPFDNFSDDKQETYFADGIQDDILTALSQVSDLKVISRTSVMQYRGSKRNMRDIGQALGVAYLLEGSVRRAADKVRITAQLIDARTDQHVWAENYDRDLADVFAIQSEVAKKIVAQLRVNISPSERAAIDIQPTRDMEAFDLYLQAKQLINTYPDTPNAKETLLKALRLLDEAISRDGNFALAYCWASRANLDLYWFDFDHTPTRLAEAKTTAQKALDLAPDLGEAHLAQATFYYHGLRNYGLARQELVSAGPLLPNNAQIFFLNGLIDRREGRWNDAVKNLEKAAELDPRNPRILGGLAVLYDLLRRYDEEQAVFDRAAAANPANATYFQMMRASIELPKGNLESARSGLDALPASYDPDGAATFMRMSLALYERDPAGAEKNLARSNLSEIIGNTGARLPRSWFEALIARAQGDEPKAQEAFAAAREKTEAKLRDHRDNGILVAQLGLIDAGLQRKSEAIAEGLRGVELRPLSSDAVDGATVLSNVAMIYAWVGDVNSAMERLIALSKMPGGPDYGQLKFDPAWDAVRHDPRFTQMLNQLRPASDRR